MPAPVFERAYRRQIVRALAWSVGAHAVLALVWPNGQPVVSLSPPVELTLYDHEVLTLEEVNPNPGGGGGTPTAPAVLEAPEASAQAEPSADALVVPVPMAPERPRAASPMPRTELLPPGERPRLPETAYAPGSGSTGTGASGTGPGTGGGTGTGDGHGTGDGTGDGAPPTGPAPLVREPDRSPFPVRFAEPAYPPEAQRARVRARVRVEVLVDEAGGVVEARIVERVLLGRGDREEPVAELPYGLDAAALAAARRCTFRPARHDGRAVRTYYTIPYAFGV